jgi:hypothetical protein
MILDDNDLKATSNHLILIRWSKMVLLDLVQNYIETALTR